MFLKYTHDRLFINLPGHRRMDTHSAYGWIEIGQDEESQSFIRVLDEGGMRWEGKPNYKSFDDALNDLEAALEKIIDEIG